VKSLHRVRSDDRLGNGEVEANRGAFHPCASTVVREAGLNVGYPKSNAVEIFLIAARKRRHFAVKTVRPKKHFCGVAGARVSKDPKLTRNGLGRMLRTTASGANCFMMPATKPAAAQVWPFTHDDDSQRDGTLPHNLLLLLLLWFCMGVRMSATE
jgi:hypothetical protein